VDPILKRGLPSAMGTWELCDQDGGHLQEELRSAGPCRRAGLFADLLPTRQPYQPGSWT
jgi:hypothetical protein